MPRHRSNSVVCRAPTFARIYPRPWPASPCANVGRQPAVTVPSSLPESQYKQTSGPDIPWICALRRSAHANRHMLGRGGWARARLCALNIGSNVLREGNVAPPWLLPRHTYKLCLKFQGRIHIWTRPWHHYVPLRVHTHRLSLSLSATSPLEFRSVHAPTFARTIHVLGPRHRVLTCVVSLQ